MGQTFKREIGEVDLMLCNAVNIGYEIAAHMRSAQMFKRHLDRADIEERMRKSLDLFERAEKMVSAQPANDHA